MLDRKFIIENADRIKQNCAQRGVKCDVDGLLALEAARRQKLLASRRPIARPTKSPR